MNVVFMGTPQAAVPSLERIISDGHNVVAVYTQPDRPSGRGNRITFSPVKACAIENGLPILQPQRIKTDIAFEEFRGFAADVLVVVAYGRILPDYYLQEFAKGAVNVHFSLLPKYRGAAPVNWAIVNGEEKTGVCSMKMDSGLDTGDILLCRETPIGPEETAPELMERLSMIGADVLSETLRSYDQLISKPQSHSDATLAPIMKREDGLIDWTLSSNQIVNRIRGFQPFPGSFTFINGKKLILWKAKTADATEHSSYPVGEVIESKGSVLQISCGGGTSIDIIEAQMEGKKRMSVRDIINSGLFTAGTRLS